MHQVRGAYPPPPGMPADIPGLELAGEVAAAGPWRDGASPKGDRVMGIVGGGGQAELATVHERQLMPVPDGPGLGGGGRRAPRPSRPRTTRSSPRRASSPASGCSCTARPGGVGTAGVQLGRAAGARVTATVRNPDHRAAVAELGAEHVIAPEGFEEHGPFDVVLELVGAPNLAGNLKALATGGRVVVIGIGAGAKAELDLARS